MVVGVTRKGALSSKRGDVEDDTASSGFRLPHVLDGTSSHPSRAEKEGFDFLVSLILGRRFRIARQRIPGIIDQNIEMEILAKVFGCGFECVFHRGWGCHVQGKFEEVGIVIGQVIQVGETPSRCDQAMIRLSCD